MEYIEKVERSVTYPLTTAEPLKSLIIGGFLWYAGTFTIIPLFFAWGYIVRILNGSQENDRDVIFDDWQKLFILGTKAFFIWGVFLSIPIINVVLLSHGTERGTIMAAFLVLLAGGGILAILIPFGGEALGVIGGEAGGNLGNFNESWDIYLLLILVWYVTPAALSNFAAKGTVKAGFDFEYLRKITVTQKYFFGWLFFLALWFAGYVLLPPFANEAGNLIFDFGENIGIDGLGYQIGEFVNTALRIFSFYLLLVAFSMISLTWEDIHAEQSDASKQN